MVGVRHEQTAVYAADGHSRVSGQLGVAVTTTGPGAANALGATGEANEVGSPVLIISTDISTSLRREGVHRGALHETRDQGAMFAPVVKRVFRVGRGQSLGDMVRQAVETALTPPTGPVYLEIPTDLFNATEPDSAPVPDSGAAIRKFPHPGESETRAAASLIGSSRKPLVWAGGGVVQSGAETALSDFARKLAAPVLETYAARGSLPVGHPCRVGLPPHQPQAGSLWDEADLVVAVGTDFDGMMTQNWAMPRPPNLIAINVDPDGAGKNYDADVELIGDARGILKELSAAIESRGGEAGLAEDLAGRRSTVYAELADAHPVEWSFLQSLEGSLGDETIVFADMCIPGYWTAAYHPFGRSRRLAYPVGWGTLGFAFPASLGAALTQPDPVLCICGDGGFLFAVGELATVAQEQIPLTLLVIDDGGYGMLRYDQQVMGHEAVGVDLASPDWRHLAAAFDLPYRAVESPGRPLAEALTEELSASRPSILVVDAEMSPPLTTSPRWYRSTTRRGVL